MINKKLIYFVLILTIVFTASTKIFGQCIDSLVGTYSSSQGGTITLIDTANSSLYFLRTPRISFYDFDCINNTFQYDGGGSHGYSFGGNGSYSTDYDTIYYNYATYSAAQGGYVCCPFSVTLIRQNTTATVLISNPSSISVCPNPFHDHTTITLNTFQKYSLELNDISGRSLRRIEFTGTQYELSSQDLAKGVYFIRLFDHENSLVSVTKIVVQ